MRDRSLRGGYLKTHPPLRSIHYAKINVPARSSARARTLASASLIDTRRDLNRTNERINERTNKRVPANARKHTSLSNVLRRLVFSFQRYESAFIFSRCGKDFLKIRPVADEIEGSRIVG